VRDYNIGLGSVQILHDVLRIEGPTRHIFGRKPVFAAIQQHKSTRFLDIWGGANQGHAVNEFSNIIIGDKVVVFNSHKGLDQGSNGIVRPVETEGHHSHLDSLFTVPA
jgi:hypothetical protein